MESLWLSGEAPERGNRKVWGSTSRYFVPRSWQDEKITITLASAKLAISLILFRDILVFCCTQSSGWMPLIIGVRWWLTYNDRLSSLGPRSIPSLQSNPNRNWAVLCDGFEFISMFSGSCWLNRFQTLCDRLCLYQERSSKLKVRGTLLTNHRKITMWGYLRIARKETHTVSNPCHSFPVLYTQQAYWYV